MSFVIVGVCGVRLCIECIKKMIIVWKDGVNIFVFICEKCMNGCYNVS